MKYHFLLIIVFMIPTSLLAGEITSLDKNSEAYRAANKLTQYMSLDKNSEAFDVVKKLTQAREPETVKKMKYAR